MVAPWESLSQSSGQVCPACAVAALVARYGRRNGPRLPYDLTAGISGRVVFPALGNGPPETVAALPQQTPGPQRRMADPDRREAKAPVRQENRPWAAATAHPSL